MSQPSPRRRRPRTKISADWLERVALAHLQRFSSSSENLRRVLDRRIYKVARAAHHAAEEQDPGSGEAAREAILAAGAELLPPLIERYVSSGLLNDQAYAEGRARALHRQGHPARAIQARLRAKGVPPEVIEGALAALEEARGDGPSPELEAAILRARRKRLGPYRADSDRADRRQRDLAALARAGFSFDIARQVIDAEDRDTLEEILFG